MSHRWHSRPPRPRRPLRFCAATAPWSVGVGALAWSVVECFTRRLRRFVAFQCVCTWCGEISSKNKNGRANTPQATSHGLAQLTQSAQPFFRKACRVAERPGAGRKALGGVEIINSCWAGLAGSTGSARLHCSASRSLSSPASPSAPTSVCSPWGDTAAHQAPAAWLDSA